MSVTDYSNIRTYVDSFQYPVPLSDGMDLKRLIGVYLTENARIDSTLQELYDQRFIDTATGRELEKIAFEVGVRRKTGESDDALRQRTFGTYGAKSSDTTFDVFANVALRVLDAKPSQISLVTPPDTTSPKTIELQVDGAVLDNSALSASELVILLDQAVSAGAKVNLVEEGTFAFAGSDSSLEGWNQGTWSSSVGT